MASTMFFFRSNRFKDTNVYFLFGILSSSFELFFNTSSNNFELIEGNNTSGTILIRGKVCRKTPPEVKEERRGILKFACGKI